MAAYNPAQPFANKTNESSPYDYMRNKATQDAGNQESQGLEAVTRRFAAMGSGNLNNGAYIQAVGDNSRAAQGRNQDAQGQINIAENQGALPYAQMAQQGGQFEKQLGFQGQQLQQQGEQFGQQLGEQKSEFGQEMPLKNRQLDLEASQQGMDAQANQMNYELGKYQSQHSGGLLGGGGTLGLGLGGSGQSGLLGGGGFGKIFGGGGK